MFAIQMRRLHRRDEKLTSVRVRSCICHTQQVRLVVPQGKVLIRELLAVDGLATSTIAIGEVTTLNHEVGDDAVE
jgi:small ligand-binding sensory domain FIST